MKQTIIYIGMGVYDSQYHGCALNNETGYLLDFKSRTTLKGLLGQLDLLAVQFGIQCCPI